MKTFETHRKGNGVREWADATMNVCLGCQHACLYCFAQEIASRFKRKTAGDWQHEELTEQANIISYPAHKGVVMFPTTHDITPLTVDAYIRVAKKILEAGNQLLLVSKPHLDCMTKVLNALRPWRDQMLCRFTIGTLDEKVARAWEPGAPSPKERVKVLKLAHRRGFRTSVAMEPLLGGATTAIKGMDAMEPYVTDTIWIGKMNRIRNRVKITTPEIEAMVAAIEIAQADDNIIMIWEMLDREPKVQWSNSIKKVLARHGKI